MTSLVERTEDRFKAASILTPVELRSAIRRRQYAGDISLSDADAAVSAIRDESLRMILHPVSPPLLELAALLVDRRNLRALDSIQLATALLASQAIGTVDTLQFVASDKKLLAAAEAEGLDTWDPTGEPL